MLQDYELRETGPSLWIATTAEMESDRFMEVKRYFDGHNDRGKNESTDTTTEVSFCRVYNAL